MLTEASILNVVQSRLDSSGILAEQFAQKLLGVMTRKVIVPQTPVSPHTQAVLHVSLVVGFSCEPVTTMNS